MAEKVEKKGLYDNRERIRLNKEIVKLNKDKVKLNGIIKDRDTMISGLETESGKLERELKEWERKQREGYTAVAINNGYVMGAVTVLPYSTFLYTQPIVKEIGSKLYNNFPFVKVVNGKMVFDSQQYKKYKGVF